MNFDVYRKRTNLQILVALAFFAGFSIAYGLVGAAKATGTELNEMSYFTGILLGVTTTFSTLWTAYLYFELSKGFKEEDSK